MAKPFKFEFAIENGNPLRLASALKGIVEALEPLTDREASDVLVAVAEMYQSPGLALELLNALEGIVKNHDKDGRVDESWWQAGREAIAKAVPRG